MTKKSGQTALILVVVTMVTVLGIGVASSTQSNLDLKNTVYSSQSEQAFACAEGGVERALAQISQNDANLSGSWTSGLPVTVNETLGGTDCSYTYTISNSAVAVNIPKLEQNMTQQLKYNGAASNISFTVTAIDALTANKDAAALAIYLYENDKVERKFYYFGTGTKPGDFTDGTSGTPFTVAIGANVKAVRLRAINSDLSIVTNTFPNSVAYKITSVGVAGTVSREMEVYRYYSQLPGAFDEVLVDY